MALLPDKSEIKNYLKSVLGPNNLERLKIIKKSYGVLKQIKSVGHQPYAIPIEELQDNLRKQGIGQGDVILVHSSVKDLYTMDSPADKTSKLHPLAYASKVIDMLISLVGPAGSILMPTDSGSGYDNALSGKVFDPAKSPSNNGAVTDLFRRRPDVFRSFYPFQNLSGWGKTAKELIEQHELHHSAYPMGKESPWYRLNDAQGKVVFLGNDFEANSSIHVAEYVHLEEYPVPTFFNAPLKMRSNRHGKFIQEVDVWMHPPAIRKIGSTNRFCQYLNDKYGIYNIRVLRGASLTIFNAKDQYEAVCKEMKLGIGLYHPFFW